MAAVEERAELHKTIWRIANDLRGSVDEANAFDYAALSDEVAESDRAGIIKDKGFFHPPIRSVCECSHARCIR